MTIFKPFINKVSALFRRQSKRPLPNAPRSLETLGEGHRGIAAGHLPSEARETQARVLEDVSLKTRRNILQAFLDTFPPFERTGWVSEHIRKEQEGIRELEERIRKLRQPQDLSKENIAKWQKLGKDEVYSFVYEAMPLFVHSTNVSMLQYFIEEKKLVVEFKGGGVYAYSNVTEDEAIAFAKEPSKGGTVWSLLRVRGSKTAHKKPYVKIR